MVLKSGVFLLLPRALFLSESAGFGADSLLVGCCCCLVVVQRLLWVVLRLVWAVQRPVLGDFSSLRR